MSGGGGRETRREGHACHLDASPTDTGHPTFAALFLNLETVGDKRKRKRDKEEQSPAISCTLLTWSSIWIPSLWSTNVSPGGHSLPLICFICDLWPANTQPPSNSDWENSFSLRISALYCKLHITLSALNVYCMDFLILPEWNMSIANTAHLKSSILKLAPHTFDNMLCLVFKNKE